ncbi:MAG: nicotinate-nucleotide diphosphorylase (carboxylating) [Kordiimonas sp.]|nr:nicotinate-nucleotide diphosphorylase (carboxylating) [Kordiimonas sp.]
MNDFPLTDVEQQQWIEQALAEDVGQGDLTTLATLPADLILSAAMVTREKMVLAGLPLAVAILRHVIKDAVIHTPVTDGDHIDAGTTILALSGNAQQILTAERTTLNLLQHLSGIATLTQTYVRELDGTDCALLDTRKTIPGYRKLAKYATRMGGARNHRMRLDDGVLIKDNHIARIGSVTAAIAAAKNYDTRASVIGITVECDTLEQAAEAIAAGADRLLLDNMSLEMLREAVQLYKGQAELEASGGVTLETIGNIARTGVDCISVGRITQSAPAVDIGLDYLD